MTLVTSKKPKPQPHQKKRTGAHQRRSQAFHKTYWPYLPMLLFVLVGLAVSNIWAARQHHVLGYATDLSAAQLLIDTNTERRKAHETLLSLNEQLSKAAQAKAEDMVARNYWSHDTPDGKQPWAFIMSAGYQYRAAGENLAYGFESSKATLVGWMNSPEHKANILNANYQEVGFGFASSPNFNGNGPETVVVAMYALPASSTISLSAQVPATAENSSLGTSDKVLDSKKVSHLTILTGGSMPWIMFVVSAFMGAGAALVITRHSLAWHKKLLKGEAFVIHHPFLDITVVASITIAFVLTQSAGYIR